MGMCRPKGESHKRRFISKTTYYEVTSSHRFLHALARDCRGSSREILPADGSPNKYEGINFPFDHLFIWFFRKMRLQWMLLLLGQLLFRMLEVWSPWVQLFILLIFFMFCFKFNFPSFFLIQTFRQLVFFSMIFFYLFV